MYVEFKVYHAHKIVGSLLNGLGVTAYANICQELTCVGTNLGLNLCDIESISSSRSENRPDYQTFFDFSQPLCLGLLTLLFFFATTLILLLIGRRLT